MFSLRTFANENLLESECHDHEACEECEDVLDGDSTVQPRAVICINCGGSSRIVKTYGPWGTIEKTCTHYPHGTDEYHKRTVYTTYICSNCGITIKTFTSEETQFVDCHGWY